MNVNIEALENLLKTDGWKALVEYVEKRIKFLEDNIYSLRLDRLQSSGTAVLIKQREAYKDILNIPNMIKSIYDEKALNKIMEDGINEIVEQLEGPTKRKDT